MNNKDILNLASAYSKQGTIMIDLKDSFFSNQDFEKLVEICKAVNYETVTIGDAGEQNFVKVGRFMTDEKEPKLVDNEFSKEVMQILNKNEHLDFYKKILNLKNENIYVRRVQVNKMSENNFIGYHLDIDSNPDYIAAVVIQLGKDFKGGEYVVYKKNTKDVPPNSFSPFFQSLILSDCTYPHEVKKIFSGERVSLVFFLCKHEDPNQRYLKS